MEVTKDTKELETKVKKSASKPEEFETVTLFKDDGKYSKDVFVCVNGKTAKVKRGKPVKIKKKFAEALANADAQRNQAIKFMSQQSYDN